MDSREGTDDLGEMRCELTRLAERLSDLAVEHSNTWRRRDQVVVDLYRAGVDPEEIACLAHLMAVDARRLAQEQANRPPGRSTGTSPAPRQDPSHP